MNAKQFSEAWEVAKSDKDLSNIDDSILFGCGLPDFKPVFTTIETVAKFLRYQCMHINGSSFDAQELDNCAQIAKKKFKIV